MTTTTTTVTATTTPPLPWYFISPTMRQAYALLATGAAASYFVRAPRLRALLLGGSLVGFQTIAITRREQIEFEREREKIRRANFEGR